MYMHIYIHMQKIKIGRRGALVKMYMYMYVSTYMYMYMYNHVCDRHVCTHISTNTHKTGEERVKINMHN